MKLQTEKGEITISSDVFTNITGAAATNCYGRGHGDALQDGRSGASAPPGGHG